MKKLALTLTILLTLSACGEKERVYTVKEFTYDRILMDETFKKCTGDSSKYTGNPGQDAPNCTNVITAFEKIGVNGCHYGGVNKECLDKYWAEN